MVERREGREEMIGSGSQGKGRKSCPSTSQLVINHAHLVIVKLFEMQVQTAALSLIHGRVHFSWTSFAPFLRARTLDGQVNEPREGNINHSEVSGAISASTRG